MKTIRSTIHIDAPTDKVWEVISDFGNIYRWNRTISASHLTSTDGHGVGTTRHCDMTIPGASVEERIVDWQEGSSYTVEIYEAKRFPFVTDMTAIVGVEPSESGSEASFQFSYDTTGGPIGKLFDRFVIGPQNNKAAALFVAALKHHVETGEEVSKGVRVDTSTADVTIV